MAFQLLLYTRVGNSKEKRDEMKTAHESMARSGNAIETIAAVAAPAPMPGFLSRFAPPLAIPAAVIPVPERLDPAERQRLMTDAADSIRRRFTGQEPDWQAVDRINREIGETFGRHELTTLLGQYTAVMGPA